MIVATLTLLGKYISMPRIPTLLGLAGMSKLDIFGGMGIMGAGKECKVL